MLRFCREITKRWQSSIITPTPLPENLPNFRHVPTVELVTCGSGQIQKEEEDKTVITLHPDIFAIEHPNPKLLKQAITWQETYKLVDMTHRVWRYENLGDGKKPWRLNTGRTRRADQKTPTSVLGTTKGNFSGPWSMWSEFCEDKQVDALIAALTVKYAQGDLVVFDDHDTSDASTLASSQPSPRSSPYLDFFDNQQQKSGEENYVLTIVGDILVPKRYISNAKTFNSLPVTGLNVLSILNHDKLHIHINYLDKIQTRLLDWKKRYPINNDANAFDNFEMAERHNFYSDSNHVEARPDWRRGDTVLDQVEADGKSYKYKNQHDFGKFFDGSEKHKEFIIRGD